MKSPARRARSDEQQHRDGDAEQILSEVRKIATELNGHRLLLRVNPDIARALKEEEGAVLRDLRSSLGKDVTVKPDLYLHHEQFDVMAV